MNRLIFFLTLTLLTGCAVQSSRMQNDQITSIQMVDRNGFSETISNQDRLAVYQNVNFLSNQPYEKVMRVFGKDHEGKSHSKITSYHANGQVSQYLEVLDGRAHGKYQEWHENGKMKIDCVVIEGMADVNPLAQAGWIFEGKSRIWDEEGQLIAEIHYEKGVLQGLSSYYHPNGQLWKAVPYERDQIDGKVMIYNEKGEIAEKIAYKKGLKHGISLAKWTATTSKFIEHYKEGSLLFAIYHDPTGKVIAEIKQGEGMKALYEKEHLASLTHYENGKPEGQIKLFNRDGSLSSTYFIKDEKKHGEEMEYYPNTHTSKLLITWYEDRIEGLAKSWYENGILESQREMSNNKKHGLCFAYYKDGQLMLMEEYDSDKLIRGSYFKRGDKLPISKIEDGFGVATLYNADGYLIQKVNYEKGNPLVQ